MLRLAVSFLVGIITGISVMIFFGTEDSARVVEGPEEIAPAISNSADTSSPEQLIVPPLGLEPIDTTFSISATPSLSDAGPQLPDTYRDGIGPPRRRLTFSERLQNFESEPIDDSWALPMEAGINNFLAANAAESGAVIDFVQCRSNWCLVAGYFLPGYPDQASMMLSPMKNEPWWQGGNLTSTHGGKLGDNESFVTLLSRFDVQR